MNQSQQQPKTSSISVSPATVTSSGNAAGAAGNQGNVKEKTLEERAKEQNEREQILEALLYAGDMRALDYVKSKAQVSEETFLEIVRENMREFGMSRKDAVEDAAHQCKIMKVTIPDDLIKAVASIEDINQEEQTSQPKSTS